MKVALDTNLLVYAAGGDSAEKRGVVLALLDSLSRDDVVIPVQVLGELYNVLVRKARRSRDEARAAILGLLGASSTVPTSPEVMTAAVDLATDHRLAIWDAVILAAASRAGCRLLLSEDMQDGFTWGGVTVADPFAAPRHALLEALMAGAAKRS